MGISKNEKIFNLLAWAQLTGVSVVGLTQNEEFFRRNLHIIDPKNDSGLLKSLDNYTFGPAGYNPDIVFLDFKSITENKQVVRKVTSSIKDSVLYYHPEENMSFFNEPAKDGKINQENIERYKKRVESSSIRPQICYDFLRDAAFKFEVHPGINFF